jgi:hypothetical protein
MMNEMQCVEQLAALNDGPGFLKRVDDTHVLGHCLGSEFVVVAQFEVVTHRR